MLLVGEEADLTESLLIYRCPCNRCSLPAQLVNKLVALCSTNTTYNLIERAITKCMLLIQSRMTDYIFFLHLPVLFSQSPSGAVCVCAINSAVFKGFIPCLDGLNVLKIY